MKHNKYNNYNNYRAVREPNEVKQVEPEKIEEEVKSNIEVDVDETAACDVVEPVVEEELPTIDGDGNKPLVGVTTTRLNIRSNPAVEPGNVVTVVNEGTVLMVDYPVEDGDWFKVCTEVGIEGYCMKEFVKISD